MMEITSEGVKDQNPVIIAIPFKSMIHSELQIWQ
jgi:hypothetical protein